MLGECKREHFFRGILQESTWYVADISGQQIRALTNVQTLGMNNKSAHENTPSQERMSGTVKDAHLAVGTSCFSKLNQTFATVCKLLLQTFKCLCLSGSSITHWKWTYCSTIFLLQLSYTVEEKHLCGGLDLHRSAQLGIEHRSNRAALQRFITCSAVVFT